KKDFKTLRQRMEEVSRDNATPDTRMADDMHHLLPAITDNLIRLMLGGLPTGRQGSPLHCRLRYFDPARRRAGLPKDVGAVVARIGDADGTVQFVDRETRAPATAQ